MSDMKLAPVEERFAVLIWENAPIASGELVKLAEKELSWKKSTTYTVLRKLCDRGIFENKEGSVVPLLTREEFNAVRGQRFVEEAYSGSLPAFLAAFASKRKLSKQEIDQIRAMIDSYEGE